MSLLTDLLVEGFPDTTLNICHFKELFGAVVRVLQVSLQPVVIPSSMPLSSGNSEHDVYYQLRMEINSLDFAHVGIRARSDSSSYLSTVN